MVSRGSAWPSRGLDDAAVRRRLSSRWVAKQCRLCRMRHRRHYAASRTMPRVGVRAAIHGHLSSGDAA